MQCEQIRPLLREYVRGTLPSYKGAWVSQHLAWCKECQFLAAEARRPPAVEAEVAVARPERSGAKFGANQGRDIRPVLYRKVGHSRIRRRSPRRRGRRLLVVAALLLLGASAVWLWRDRLLALLPDVSWTELLVKLGIFK